MVIGTAERPARGESVCGDRHLVVTGCEVIIAVVDGLGHGPEAAAASKAFCDVVEENVSRDIEAVMRKATQMIATTRGAAGALVRIDEQKLRMSFCGVGNIEFRSVSRNPIRPICVPGIIGRRLRKVKVFDYDIAPGDLFLLHTDGVSTRFELERFRHLAPQDMADEILRLHGKHHDDATCVAVRLDPR